MAKLTESQRKQLSEYLEEKKSRIVKENPTTTKVAAWAREALKFEIDQGNITHRVGPNGKLWEHQWPGTEGSTKGRAVSRSDMNLCLEQLYVLHAWASQLFHVLTNYGYTVNPPARLPELKERVEEARRQLAMTDHREEEEK